MKTFILCAVFLVLGGKQTYGAVNLDFLNHPDFPGNAGYNAKLNQYIQNTMDNAMQSAGSYSGSGYTGNYPGSNNVVISPVVQSLPDGTSTFTTPATVTGYRPMRRPRPPRPPRVVAPRPPRVVRPRPPRPPRVVRPRPPRPSSFRPDTSIPSVTTIGENNIIMNPGFQTWNEDGQTVVQTPNVLAGKPSTTKLPDISSGSIMPETTVVDDTIQGLQGSAVANTKPISTNIVQKPLPAVVQKPSHTYTYGPDSSKMRIPHAPPNFPFPPECTEVADPGYKFPALKQNNVQNIGINNVNQESKMKVTAHRSFLCTDPEYSQDSFYMQITEYSMGDINSATSRNAAYYDKNGKSFYYSRKMVMLPIGESLPNTPYNDYLGMSTTGNISW